MQTSSSAYRTCRESRSASEWTATVFSPISLQARITRRAISPRLAMRTLEIMRKLPVAGSRLPETPGNWQPATGNPNGASDSHREQLLTVLDRLPILRKHFHDLAVDVRFDFVHQLHRLDDAEHFSFADVIADRHEGIRLRIW